MGVPGRRVCLTGSDGEEGASPTLGEIMQGHPTRTLHLRSRACFLFLIEKLAPAVLVNLKETALPLAEEVYRQGRVWSEAIEWWEPPLSLDDWRGLEREAKQAPDSKALMEAILEHRQRFRLLDRDDDPWLRQEALDTLHWWLSVLDGTGMAFYADMKPHNYDQALRRARETTVGKVWKPLVAEYRGRPYIFRIARLRGRREKLVARMLPYGWRLRGSAAKAGGDSSGPRARAARKRPAKLDEPFENSESLFRLVRFVVLAHVDRAPHKLLPVAKEIGLDLHALQLHVAEDQSPA